MTTSLTSQFRELMNKEKDFNMKCEAEFDVQYPTMFLNLDFLNGQRIHVDDKENGRDFEYDSVGIVDGTFNLFIGRSGCGKSTIAKQMAANIIKPYELGSIFEDSIEGGITHRRNEILTGFTAEEIPQRLLIRNAGVTCESFYKRIKAIYDIKTENANMYKYDTGLFDSRGNRIYKFQPTIYILDSLAMLMPEKITQEEELSGQMSTTAAAKMIAATFRRITPLLKAANIILFVINHITNKVEINPFAHSKSQLLYLKQDETCPGGNTPFYLANNIFRLDDGSKLYEGKDLDISGCITRVELIKSRTNRAGVSTNLVFNQDIGFDPDLSLYLMLKENGRINGAGAYLYIGDHSDKKFAQKNFKSKLYEDSEFREYFIDECFNILHNSLYKDQLNVLENSRANSASNDILNRIHQVNNNS